MDNVKSLTIHVFVAILTKLFKNNDKEKKNMKKFYAALCAGVMAVSLGACSSSSNNTAKATAAAATSTPAATEEAATSGEYKITNKTGEKVTELYVYSDESDKGENYAADGLDDGAEVTVTKDDQEAGTTFTLEYVTESGRDEKFTTLNLEDVSINLISEDAMSGSTPIQFTE